MFIIPNESVTQVAANEVFYISSMGNGRASLCGNKVCFSVSSEGLHLGMKFIATRTNRLVPKDLKDFPKTHKRRDFRQPMTLDISPGFYPKRVA